MDGPRDSYTKWNKPNKDKYPMISSYVESKKIRYRRAHLQNRNKLTDKENKLMVTKGERVEGGRTS